MADRKEEIEFGGQVIKVPAWASEAQMEVLNKLSADNLKEVQKLRALDKGILTAVTKMMSDNERLKSKETKENEKILKTIEGLDKTIVENSKSERDQDKKNSDDIVNELKNNKKEDDKQKKERDAAEKQLRRDLKTGAENLRDATGGLLKGIGKGDFEGMATAIGSFVGLGAAAGVAAGVISEFGKGLSVLADSGAGFGMSLLGLRQMSTQTGMDIGELGKLAAGNSLAFRALGSNVNEGFQSFAALSQGLRTLTTETLNASGARVIETKRLSQYGLSNQAFNEILAEEIDLRRRAGMNQQQITDRLNGSFRNLIRETTLLAGVTGVDRRSILQARQTAADNPANRRFLANNQSMNSVFGTFANVQGEVGNEIVQAILSSARSGGRIQMANFGNVVDALNMVGDGGQTTAAMQDLTNYITQNQARAEEDPEGFGRVFTATIQRDLGSIYSNITDADITALEDRRDMLAASGMDTSKEDQALEFISGIAVYQGTTIEKQIKALQDAAVQLERRGAMDLESATKNLSLGMKEGIMKDFVNISGIDIGDDRTGDRMVALFDDMGADFAELGFLKGMYEQLSKLDATTLAMLAALTGGSFLGPAMMGALGGLALGAGKSAVKGVLGLGKSGLKMLGFGGGAALAAGQQGAETVTKQAAAQAAETAVKQSAGTIAEQISKTTAGAIAGGLGKKVPLIGLGIGAALGGYRALQGDFVGAGMEVASGGASVVPGLGTAASIAIDAAILARDIADIYRAQYPEATDEEIARLSASAAGKELITQLNDKISRSESGEDQYWGRENEGQMEDRKRVNDLLVSEINRLNRLMETTGKLNTAEQEQLASFTQQLIEMENRTAIDPYERIHTAELQREANEDPALRLLLDTQTKLQNELFKPGGETDPGRRKMLMDEYEVIRAEIEEFINGGWFGSGDTPTWVESAIDSANSIREALVEERDNLVDANQALLDDASVSNADGLVGDLLDTFNENKEKLQKINEDLDNIDFASLYADKKKLNRELDTYMFNAAGDYIDEADRTSAQNARIEEVMVELKAIDTVLQRAGAFTASDGSRALEINAAGNNQAQGNPSFPSDAMLKVHSAIENKLKQSKADLAGFKSEYGEAKVIGQEEDLFGDMVDVYGYDNQEQNRRYQEIQRDIRKNERGLQRTEKDLRYKTARASELASEMGIEDTRNIKFETEGNTVTSINGQAVPTDLLTDRERQNADYGRQLRDSFNNRPVTSSNISNANDPVDREDTRNNNNNQQSPQMNEDLMKIMMETNRLLRKQTTVIEEGQ